MSRFSPETWARIERLFAEALDREPADRIAWVEESDEDPAVISETLRLLRSHDASDDFLAPLDPDRAAALVRAGGGEGEAPTRIGPYRVIRPVARGGMGIVFLARDDRLERDVALKVLPGWLEADPVARERFLAEARAASRLDHPNILTVHDVGETPDGGLYIAMAFYEGETLAERIARGPLPVNEALDLARQVADGLAAAHARGIVHRDIKPANVVVTPAGRARIVDFGIAKGAGAQTTRAGVRLGTIAYMSPEQTRGEPLDARTDVWSFGALLYEMLAGRRPFAADDDAVVIHAIRHDDPPALDGLRTGVPETAARLVERCLRKDPADRFPDARGLVTALDSDPAQPGPHGLFSELRRRHVFRVVAVYGATAFVVLQLADIVFPALGLPAWSLSLVLALLVVGFPLAVVLAWAFELTPQGVRRTPPEIPADPRSAGPRPGRNRAATAIALLAGVTALGVLGWAGARWLDRPAAERNDPAPAMDSADGMPVPDPQRVAVLPFSSPPDDDELNRLGRDLVITLAPALDGLGDLRTVDGTTIAAHVASRQPLQTTSEGLDLARQLGAGRVVRGSLVRADQTGTDETVRADVAVISTESGEAEVRITVEAPDGNIGVLTDSITLALVRSLWPSDRLPSFEPGALSTRSVAAMRAFLEGELATAEGRWRDAPDHFARAFEIDSTFWLAGARYLDAMAYRSRPVDPAVASWVWDHRDELPERQRALMEAGRADSLSQRLAQARALAERYPDSWRAWFGLADQLMHNGLFLGATQDEARAAIERAVALNPTSSTLWQHLFWMALADRDTAATGGAIRRLAELGADSASLAEVGLDQVRFFRLLQGLAATGDAPDRAATDTLARQLVGYVGPLDLSRVGGEVSTYGFPRGETVLEEVTLSLPVSASARRGALRSLAEALAARGAWDSALVVLDEYVASASGSEPVHDAWRIAAIGRWLGALEPVAGAGWREALARAPGLDLPARAEITWLDGIVASRDDPAGLSDARAGLGRLAAEAAPGSVDSVTVAFLDRSLAALERADRGQIAAAADAMLALERERAEHIWFRRTGDSHPYLTAVNRLSAARWLQETERAAEAEALLRWHESVQFPAWRHARADATLRGVIEFRRARVSEAVGRDAAAREHDARALEVLDLAEGTLASMVDSAQAALGL